jgi:hypothetical protein
MARQGKHIRFQVAHKAAQMMAEEGISDYAFAKRKAAKFFGLMDGDALPSNDEINDAIKEHQAIYFDEEHEERLKILRLEALSLMKKLIAFNPHLTGGALDGTAGRYPTIHIQLYADSMKEVEFFLLNHNIAYETRDRKSHTKDPMKDKKKIPILILEGSMGPIELLIYHVDDLKINKLRGSIAEINDLIVSHD